MSTIDQGTQRITIKFGNALEGKELSYRFNCGIAGWKGIISGGWVTRLDNTTVSVSPLVCEVPYQNQQYRIQTQDVATVTGANPTTSRLILTYTYRRQHTNYATLSCIASATAIQENQIVLADLVFSGATMSSSFIYDNRKLLEPGEVGDTTVPATSAAVLDQTNGLGGIYLKDIVDGKLYQMVVSAGSVVAIEKAAAHS